MTVEFDGHKFENCTFTRCVLVYRGGREEVLGNTFTDCHWQLKGSAANTIAFLRDLYASGWQKDIEGILGAIKGIPLPTIYRGH